MRVFSRHLQDFQAALRQCATQEKRDRQQKVGDESGGPITLIETGQSHQWRGWYSLEQLTTYQVSKREGFDDI